MAAEASIRGAWIINAVLVLGCVWTASNTMKQAPKLTVSLERKAKDLAALHRLEQERSGFTGYVSAFESLPIKEPPSFETLVANAMPGIRPGIRPLPSKPVGDGWETRRVEVTFENIHLGGLGNLLQSSSRQRPPWRLVDWSITASGTEPGKGAARLVFEALGKSGGA